MPKSENQVVPNRYSVNSETDESDDYDDSEEEVSNLDFFHFCFRSINP